MVERGNGVLKRRFESIKYTIDHRKAFIKLEKKILGYNTLRGYLHDLDKVFLKIFLSPELTHKIHRSYSKHHARNARTEEDYIQMIIDMECARFTKPDKPLNARDTLKAYYPYLVYKLEPLLKKLGL